MKCSDSAISAGNRKLAKAHWYYGFFSRIKTHHGIWKSLISYRSHWWVLENKCTEGPWHKWLYQSRISIDPTVQDIHLIPLYRISIFSHCTGYLSYPIVQDIHLIPLYKISIWFHCTGYQLIPLCPFVTLYSHTLGFSMHVKSTQTPQVKRRWARIRVLIRDFVSQIKTDQHVLKQKSLWIIIKCHYQ